MLCLGALLAGAQVASAQSSGNARILEVDLWFLFLDESGGSFYVKNGSSYELLSNAPYSVQSPKTFTPGERVEIYRANRVDPVPLPNEEEEQRPKYVKIADVSAPNNAESALVVLAPRNPNDPFGSYNHRIYEEDARDRSEGSVKLINLGRSRAAALLGGERVLLEPGETVSIKPPRDEHNRVRIQIADSLHGDWQVIERRTLFLRPGERMTGVLVYSPSGMKHLYSQSELLSLGENPPPAHAWLQYKH